MANGGNSGSQESRTDYTGLFVAMVVAAVVLVYLFWTGYRDAIDKARTSAAGVARIYAAQLRASLGGANELLRDLSARVPPRMASPVELELFWQTEKQHLGSFLAYSPEFSTIHLFAADGRLLQSTGDGEADHPLSVADRDYFQALKKNPRGGLVLSEVLVSRLTGKRSIVLARALLSPAGEFLGVVAIPLDFAFLENQLTSAEVGPQGSISLYRSDDSRLVAQVPVWPQAINQPEAEHPFLTRIRAGERSGFQIFSGRQDGVERLYTFQTVANYPWHFVVGMATADVLAAWKARMLLSALLAVCALISLAVLFRRLATAHALLQHSAADLQKLKMAVEQSPVSVVITDPEGCIEYANPAFTRTTGYELAEVRGQTPRLLKSGETPPAEYEALWACVAQGRSWSGVFHNRKKSGELYWESAQISPVVDDAGNITNFLGIKQDVTEQYAAAAALGERERLLSTIFDASSVAIFLLDLQGRITVANRRMAQMFAIPLESLPACDYVDLVVADEREASREKMRQLLASEIDHVDHERHYRRRDGSLFWGRLTGRRMLDGEGRSVGLLGVVIDITQRKQVVAELERYRDHLEELVVERTRQIEILNAELEVRAREAEAASHAKSSFLANMSHEIRTPMNAIVGLSHLLGRGNADPGQREKIDKISDAATHLLQVINDILDFSKIEAGKLVLERVDFDLGEVMQNVCSLLEERAGAKGVALVVEQDAALLANGRMSGDPTRLAQALLNYVSNAVKFTDSGAVTVCARLVEEGENEVLLRLEVRDTGVGISPDNLSRLFAAFEQGDASTTRKFGGTGLGLVIASRLARLMGGTVGVESQLGAGSTFWLTARLGRAPGPSGARPRAESGSLSPGGSLLAPGHADVRLLLAEDDPINQEVALDLLRGTGLLVDLAENGRQALDLAGRTAYDLILMDMQMPEMDGLAATSAIRRLPQHAATPILALTANAFTDDRRLCLEAGMSDHLTKPIDPDRLFAALLRWLPPGEKPAAPAAAVDAPAFPPLPPAGQAGVLDVAFGLKVMRGRLDSYRRLLRQFAAGQAGSLAALERSLRAGRLAEVQSLAHAMKGASGNLGAVGLQAAAAELEAALRENRPAADTDILLDALKAESERLLAAIDGAFPESEAARSAPLERDEFLVLIRRLEELLLDDDFRASEVLRSASGPLQAAFGETARTLEQHVHSFDYPRALATLRAAMRSLEGETKAG